MGFRLLGVSDVVVGSMIPTSAWTVNRGTSLTHRSVIMFRCKATRKHHLNTPKKSILKSEGLSILSSQLVHSPMFGSQLKLPP